MTAFNFYFLIQPTFLLRFNIKDSELLISMKKKNLMSPETYDMPKGI